MALATSDPPSRLRSPPLTPPKLTSPEPTPLTPPNGSSVWDSNLRAWCTDDQVIPPLVPFLFAKVHARRQTMVTSSAFSVRTEKNKLFNGLFDNSFTYDS